MSVPKDTMNGTMPLWYSTSLAKGFITTFAARRVINDNKRRCKMKFNMMQEYFDNTISAIELMDKIDEIIFDFIFVYGQSGYDTLAPKVFADHIYWLKELRDLLAKSA